MNRDGDLDLIKKYHQGDLTDEEKEALESRLEEDKELMHLFNLQKVMLGKSFPDPQLLKQVELATSSNPENTKRKLYYAVAAAVVVLMVSIYVVSFLNVEEHQKLGNYSVQEAKQTELGFAGTGTLTGDSVNITLIEDEGYGYLFNDQLTIFWPHQDTYSIDGLFYLPSQNSYHLVFEKDTFQIFKTSERLPFKMD